MFNHISREEALVLQTLETAEVLALEQVIEGLPELSWSQLFHAVDALSRRGEIEIRRRGFQYELNAVRRRSAPCLGAPV